MIAMAILVKVALTPAFSLLPLLVKDYFHGGPSQLGAFEALFGVGVVAGGLLLGVWGGFTRKIRTIQLGTLILGVGITALAFVPGHLLLVGLACLFTMGFAIPLVDGPFLAILQTTVPPDMQGRVFGVTFSLLSLSSPLGLLLAGPLSDRLGLPIWYAAAGVLALLLGSVGFLIPALLRIEAGSDAAIRKTQS
jgi:DHA3 family macrolide efflux protein-like MFS transporter